MAKQPTVARKPKLEPPPPPSSTATRRKTRTLRVFDPVDDWKAWHASRGGMPIWQLAQHHACSESTVRKAIMRHGSRLLALTEGERETLDHALGLLCKAHDAEGSPF